MRIDIVVRRGSIAESRHRVQAAVCDTRGRAVACTERSDRVTTFRSAAKPFQLVPLVERGHADRWGFGPEQLAVMVASHTGSAAHVALVAGILERIGLTDRHLACGFHEPIDPESRAALQASNTRSPIYNNCSGKHAGMLCLALSEGWPVEGYERPEHPVQRLMRETVAEVCGLTPEALGVAIDGCSVSVFALPLAAMACGYARLASAVAAPPGDLEASGGARDQALARIGAAMRAHPQATGGTGRLGTALIEATGGRLIAKGGAEGLECIAWPARGLGIAVKCEDGAERAVGPAVVALLERLAELSRAEHAALASWAEPVLTNHAGLEVGRLEAEIQVLQPMTS